RISYVLVVASRLDRPPPRAGTAPSGADFVARRPASSNAGNATTPRATANHRVATRMIAVAAIASGGAAPVNRSRAAITASVPPSPPGTNDSAPARIAVA